MGSTIGDLNCRRLGSERKTRKEMGAMRKIVVLIMLVAFGFSTVAVMAQEEQDEASTEHMTQGELAQMLVRVLGLYRFLPPSPSDGECIAILLANRISPADGWKVSAPVTQQDLARVIVLAIGEEDSVENPDDPDSWVELLQAMGVPMDTPANAAGAISPSEYTASGSFSPLSTDPLQAQRVLANPDERQLQGDLGATLSIPLTRQEVVSVIRSVDPDPVRPTPATPN